MKHPQAEVRGYQGSYPYAWRHEADPANDGADPRRFVDNSPLDQTAKETK